MYLYIYIIYHYYVWGIEIVKSSEKSNMKKWYYTLPSWKICRSALTAITGAPWRYTVSWLSSGAGPAECWGLAGSASFSAVNSSKLCAAYGEKRILMFLILMIWMFSFCHIIYYCMLNQWCYIYPYENNIRIRLRITLFLVNYNNEKLNKCN